MKCPDCNGKGFYVLLYSSDNCNSCDGTGEMDPAVIERDYEPDFELLGVPDAIEFDDTEPLFELGQTFLASD